MESEEPLPDGADFPDVARLDLYCFICGARRLEWRKYPDGNWYYSCTKCDPARAHKKVDLDFTMCAHCHDFIFVVKEPKGCKFCGRLACDMCRRVSKDAGKCRAIVRD